MTRTTKLVTINVTAAPGGSALANFVASMGVNTWAKFGSGTLTSALVAPTGGDPVTSFASKAVWDGVHKRVIFLGQAHASGTPYMSLAIVWDDATNTWTNSEPPPVPTGTVSHGYDLTTINPLTGDLYFHRYADHVMRRKPWGGSWSDTAPDPLDATDVSGGTQWNPYANGGAGGVVFANQYGIATYNPASNSWTKHTGITSVVQLSGYDMVSFYDPTAQSVYICGGSTYARSCVKVTAAGAFSQMGAMPADTGVPNGSGPNRHVTTSGWINPNNGNVVKPVLIGPVGCYEYTSATDSWASIATRPFTPVNGAVFMASIPTYNCIFVCPAMNSAGACDTWIWRRA